MLNGAIFGCVVAVAIVVFCVFLLWIIDQLKPRQ